MVFLNTSLVSTYVGYPRLSLITSKDVVKKVNHKRDMDLLFRNSISDRFTMRHLSYQSDQLRVADPGLQALQLDEILSEDRAESLDRSGL